MPLPPPPPPPLPPFTQLLLAGHSGSLAAKGLWGRPAASSHPDHCLALSLFLWRICTQASLLVLRDHLPHPLRSLYLPKEVAGMGSIFSFQINSLSKSQVACCTGAVLGRGLECGDRQAEKSDI